MSDELAEPDADVLSEGETETETETERDLPYAQHPTLSRQIGHLQDRLDATERRAEQADALAKTALDRLTEKDEQIEALEAETEALRAHIDDLREEQSLLQHVDSARDLTVDERAMVCLQTLYDDARNSEGEKAYMTVREGWTELGRSIPRPRVYDVFERAETLVDDDHLCWYQKEPRGSQPPSRLMLDVSTTDLPDELDGHVVRRGVHR